MFNDLPSRATSTEGHAPIDSAFSSPLSREECQALLAPFTTAAEILGSVGKRVRLLSSLQPLEAGPELERDFTSGKIKNPYFTYTNRASDISELRNTLNPIRDIEIESGDPLVGEILNNWVREKIRERLLEIDIVAARGNMIPGEGSPILELSRQLFGAPPKSLVEHCESHLQSTGAKAAETLQPTGNFTPHEVQQLIEARYMIPWFNGRDLPAWSVKINANQGVTRCFNSPEERTFFIGNRLYSPQYVEQLIRHEMLHVYRAVLGLQQAGSVLHELLSCGLAGYEMAEEGLAIVSETSCNPDKEFRKQTLYARVVTADSALQTLSFREAYERLRDLNLSANNAYNVVLGTYRGGGFLKDALYLQGALHIRERMDNNEDLTPLFVGKTGLHHQQETWFLLRRGLLAAPTVIPQDFQFFFDSSNTQQH